MDPVQSLQDLDHFVVLGSSHGLADKQAVLRYSAPCHPRGLCWGNGGEGLVAP